MLSAERVVGTSRSNRLDLDFQEESLMFEDSKESSGRRKDRSRHRKRRGHRRDADFEGDANDVLASIDESLLSEQERAYREAQRFWDRKVDLSRRVLRASVITIPLLIFVTPVGVVALIYFVIKLGRRGFRLFYEPQLRERFLQEEVHRRVRRRVTTERRHLEGEHHRSLEQLSASIAHEIRNPITAAKSLVQQLGEEPDPADQAEYARVAVAELERVERSISHLLRYAREEDTQIGAIVMEDVLESALETFRDRAARGHIEIVRHYDERGSLEGDSEQLRRVVINLVGNAIDALEEARVERPEIRVSMGENLAGTEVWVRIADNGLGIADEVRDRIFDPFFTSRSTGTGLGLALSRKIVGNHGGSIEVDSIPGEGTEFILTFPKARRDSGKGASKS